MWVGVLWALVRFSLHPSELHEACAAKATVNTRVRAERRGLESLETFRNLGQLLCTRNGFLCWDKSVNKADNAPFPGGSYVGGG